MDLYTSLEKVKVGDRENLLQTLSSMGDFDCDFNGENGLDYLWDEVWDDNGYEDREDFELQQEKTKEEIELRYENNLEWLLDKIKDIEDDRDCIETFFDIWMEHDRYYEDYEVRYLCNNKGQVNTISFVTIHND